MTNIFFRKELSLAQNHSQVQVVDRILQMQGRPPLLADPNLDWAMNVGAQITPRTSLPGYSYVRVGDRQLLHQVVLISRHFLCLFHLYKALNLPQNTAFPSCAESMSKLTTKVKYEKTWLPLYTEQCDC